MQMQVSEFIKELGLSLPLMEDDPITIRRASIDYSKVMVSSPWDAEKEVDLNTLSNECRIFIEQVLDIECGYTTFLVYPSMDTDDVLSHLAEIYSALEGTYEGRDTFGY